ncbi:iron-sulfur binding protein [Candidatus Magnetoovum chiemensis]|nr:iron-sulfur binding protein [Candidatus Magnetoovum chiemensis]
MFRFNALSAETVEDIKHSIDKMLSQEYASLLPSDKAASILIKPNLNSNMNALTGNTTDLRLIAAVVESLKSLGFNSITIGEGTNSGFYRSGISVISRLRIAELAKYYNIAVKDLNYSDTVDIEFENGVKAQAARECLESAFLINMPKLKTHFEAGMSVCLKNLMGCLAGQTNKKKTHQSLSANILNISKVIKPNLHIVDAIISMEGLGPTRGTPVTTGMIFVGTDPLLIDLACAKFASFDYEKARTLKLAKDKGLIDSSYYEFVGKLEFPRKFNFAPPKAGPIASFIHSPKRQKYFLAVRNTALFNYLCSTKIVGKALFLTGLRQDVFIDEDMELKSLTINKTKCVKCGKCAQFCPVSLNLPDALSNNDKEKRCIECMYCFCICPNNAVEYEGRLGFMEEQLRQYDSLIRLKNK